MAKYMQELEHMLCDELDKIAERGELTAGTLDTVQKLTHSIQSLKTIEAMDDYSNDDYRRDIQMRFPSTVRSSSLVKSFYHLNRKISFR